MGLFTKEMLGKILAGTTLVGGIAWGTAVWTGQADLDSISSMYDRVLENYNQAKTNITVYEAELLRRAGLISDSDAKISILNAKIESLEQQLANAEQGSSTDAQTIKDLREQVKTLQAQVDSAITEEDFNAVTAEVDRLNKELSKANQAVATLKTTIANKDADVRDIEPVTAEQLQAGVTVNDLYYTWSTDNNNAAVNNYLDGLNVLQEKAESPVLLSGGIRNTYTIGNMRAYRALYNKINGNGSFQTTFNNKYDEYVATHPDESATAKFYNAINSMPIQFTVDGKTYTVRYDNTVPLTPGGQTLDYDAWIDSEGRCNF